MMAIFCDNHALGIVNYLSQSIENPSASSIEKTRSVQALQHLVQIGQVDVLVALPQVSHAIAPSQVDDR